MVKRNPVLFNDIVLTMKRSEADHLHPTNFSAPIGMEDVVDWIVYINGETKNHFFDMALKGKLTSKLDVNKLA